VRMRYCPVCGRELGEAEIDGMQRLGCPSEACDYVFWDNPTPVVAAVVERDGKIVLARNREWPEKIFGLVTGFLEKGESPDQGILREVMEELGLEGRIESFIGNYSFFQMNQLIVAFHVKATGQIRMGDELAEIREVPPERLRPWGFGTGEAVRDWLKARKNQSGD
jgi:NADH pyrophosphatase NudC (nudix superfamily)